MTGTRSVVLPTQNEGLDLPSASIIIPTCQRAELLPETLNSLASQSEGDFEVIVVCDGEDPQTRALSEGCSADYPLRWIFVPENQGLPSARNAGAHADRRRSFNSSMTTHPLGRRGWPIIAA